MGIFGDLFDLNNDGQMDAFERAAEFGCVMNIIESEKNDKLVSAGIDPSDLKNLSYSERRRVLINAGLDPDEFDF